MFAYLALAAAAAQVAAPDPAPARIAAAPPVTAQTIVDQIRPRLPQAFSPEVRLVGAEAQGDLLVLTVEAAPARLAAITPAGVEAAVAVAFCAPANARSIMAGPLALRVDARAPGGQTVTGTVIDTCPPPPPPGRSR